MFKPKTPISGRLENSSGGRTRREHPLGNLRPPGYSAKAPERCE
jgi:hypothetical protein